jgi:hypothetical protein
MEPVPSTDPGPHVREPRPARDLTHPRAEEPLEPHAVDLDLDEGLLERVDQA